MIKPQDGSHFVCVRSFAYNISYNITRSDWWGESRTASQPRSIAKGHSMKHDTHESRGQSEEQLLRRGRTQPGGGAMASGEPVTDPADIERREVGLGPAEIIKNNESPLNTGGCVDVD